MIVHCVKCGEPAARVTPPQLGKGETFALGKMLKGFGGIDLSAILGALSDSKGLGEAFAVHCMACDE